MDQDTKLLTVENNAALVEIARQQLSDPRIEFILADGYDWLKNYKGEKFDLIFADAMPGKYDLFEETIALLKPADFILLTTCCHSRTGLQDMQKRLMILLHMLESRKDLVLTKMNWSTGIIIAVKK